jgi:hypothetical protein
VSEPTDDKWARAYVAGLVEQGRAEELMEAWSLYGQTWPYLAGIIDHVAEEGSSMTAQEFARSLQEESHK